MNLEHLTDQQLNVYFRETKWILHQLSWVKPNSNYNDKVFYEIVERIDAQVTALQDALRVERARRALVHLQAQIGVEESTAVEKQRATE